MQSQSDSRFFSREEVAKHNTANDQYLIIDNKVYDITKWINKHPGGKVITYYKGEDATDVVKAFHPNLALTEKYMKALCIGTLTRESFESAPNVIKEFRQLRQELENEGRFHSNSWFYILNILHILLLEALGVFIISQWGNHWFSMLTTSLLLATAQAQAGWTQHDFGHLAVFYKNRKWNQFWHHFTIGGLKGASSNWWKSRHNRHHAKTNVIRHDPDIHTEPVFIWGTEMLRKGWSLLPYQQFYWWVLGPPTVTTIVFVFQNLFFVLQQGLWVDFLWVVIFFVRYIYSYNSFLSGWEIFSLYLLTRFWESHWFTWVTSMSHLPRPIRVEHSSQNWVSLNAIATQNIANGFFHDWFTGHLNYQLEHHLFPSMPRHQLPYVATRVRQLCEKNGLPYNIRSIRQCCQDIIDKLAVVGKAMAKEQALKSN